MSRTQVKLGYSNGRTHGYFERRHESWTLVHEIKPEDFFVPVRNHIAMCIVLGYELVFVNGAQEAEPLTPYTDVSETCSRASWRFARSDSDHELTVVKKHKTYE